MCMHSRWAALTVAGWLLSLTARCCWGWLFPFEVIRMLGIWGPLLLPHIMRQDGTTLRGWERIKVQSLAKCRLSSCHQKPRNVAPSTRNQLLSCPFRWLPVNLPFAKWNANCRVIILIKHELDGYWQFAACNLEIASSIKWQGTDWRCSGGISRMWMWAHKGLHSQIQQYLCLPHTTASLSPPPVASQAAQQHSLPRFRPRRTFHGPVLRKGKQFWDPKIAVWGSDC